MFHIKKNDLLWRNTGWFPLDKNRIKSIILHHMAHPTATIYDVHKWHLDRWSNEPGFGYNYFITLDGEIIEGRGNHRGAHAGAAYNTTSIGIGFQGNYDDIKGVGSNFVMPDKQYNAGIWLINEVKKEYKNIDNIGGHKDFVATTCPGKYFPLQEMVNGSYRGSFLDVPNDYWSYPTIEKALQLGVMVGVGDGLFEPKRASTREELAQVAVNIYNVIMKEMESRCK